MKILKQRPFLSSFCVKISSYVFISYLSFFLLGDCCELCINYHLWIFVVTSSFSEKFWWNDKSDLEDRDRLRQWIHFGDLVVFVSVFFKYKLSVIWGSFLRLILVRKNDPRRRLFLHLVKWLVYNRKNTSAGSFLRPVLDRKSGTEMDRKSDPIFVDFVWNRHLSSTNLTF
jgi:hypothetical protein